MLGLGLVAIAAAGPQNFSNRLQTIRAGVVLLDADTSGGSQVRSAAPYAFFNLDSNSTIKPAGWNFVNPTASSFISPAAAARWSAITGTAIAPYTPISKRNAPYWEVRLSSLTDEQLGQYDILLVAPSEFVSLNTAERNKLRKFADQGGILWVDLAGLPRAIDTINNFPVSFQIQNGAEFANTQIDTTQPLMSRPFSFNSAELRLLNGMPWASQKWTIRAAQPSAQLDPLFGSVVAEFLRIQPAMIVDTRFTVGISRIGDGFMVVSSRGPAYKLSRTVDTGLGPLTNMGFFGADPVLSNDGVASAKFAVNLISMASQFRQQGGGSRRTGATFTNLDAPLMRQFQTEVPTGSSSGLSSPVVYKGVAIMSTGDRLIAYDLDPNRDLDNDGNPDDGLPDALNATGRGDILWISQAMAGPISAPAAFELPRPAGARPNDQVAVVENTGRVRVFPIFPRDANNFIQANNNLPALYQLAPPNGAAAYSGNTPNAPTVHEGLLFISDRVAGGATQLGRIWIVNLRSEAVISQGGNPFVLGGSSSVVTLPAFSAGATVGYIPIFDNSGGYDRVIYLPHEGAGSAANPNNAAGVISVWFGAKGERPLDVDVVGSSLQVTTRANQQGNLPIWFPNPAGSEREFSPRLTVIDANGNPWTSTQMENYFGPAPIDASGGIINFPFRPGAPAWPANVSVRVDYHLNWAAGIGGSGELQSLVRGQLNIPDGTGGRSIIGSVALAPDSTFYITTAAVRGGSLFGFREEGRGVFRCILRYDLYDRHNVRPQEGIATTVDAVFPDNDPVNNFLPGPPTAQLQRFTFRSAPVIRDGQIFVAASATKAVPIPPFGNIPLPYGVLMAFRAGPQNLEIPVGNVGTDVSLLQPDMARSNLSASPPTIADDPDQYSVLQDGNFSYDRERGIIRITNLMANVNGPIQNSLSQSQPVLVRTGSGPDRIFFPDSVAGGSWNPLQWYTVVPGFDVPLSPSSVYVGGNTVYFTGNSQTPNVLNGLNPITTPPAGVIYAYDAQVPANDQSLFGTAARPWQRQMYQIVPAGAGIAGNERVRWPQLKGISSFEDFVIRLNQATIYDSVGTGSRSYGIVGADNTLLAVSNGGVTGFTRSDFVVADQNRIGIFDASGNAVFTTDAVANQGSLGTNGAANIRAISRPSRAYSIGNDQLLVADPGANRVLVMNGAGREERSIGAFRLDPNVVPAGFPTNGPTQLANPSDVQTWAEYVRVGANPLVTNQQPLEYWVHWLIADTGNRRLVHLIDRYAVDATSGRILDAIKIGNIPQVQVLFWHSDMADGGYDYHSVQRVLVPASPLGAARFLYVAGMAGTTPTSGAFGTTAPGSDRTGRSGNGGIVVLDPSNPRFVRVFNQMVLPNRLNTPFWDQTSGTWQAPSTAPDPVVRNRYESVTRAFVNLASVTARVVALSNGNPALRVMVAESTGVYELDLPVAADPGENVAPVVWMLPNEAYTVLRRIGATGVPSGNNPASLRATYARRLDSGEVLVVNGFLGLRRNNESFFGEILQLNGNVYNVNSPNLGFGLSSIQFVLGSVQGARGIIQPVFADRR